MEGPVSGASAKGRSALNSTEHSVPIFPWLTSLLNSLGTVWIFALMFLICADIAGRTLFDRPLQAVPEIVSLSLIGCVFLQIAFAIDMNRLTRAELLLDQIRNRQPAFASSAWIRVT